MPRRSAAPARRWYRGNLHTHTTNSDGDSDPDVVVAWYRDAGYDFLALTDHDLLTLPADHALAAGPMLLVHGEEVTAGDVHVNGLGVREAIPPVYASTVAETLQRNVDAVEAAGGIASVNHPNYQWHVRSADLLALRGCSLFEVHNGGPETNDAGGVGRPSTEEQWDAVLMAGRRLRAIAVDDAHHFRVFGHRYANPGRGWIHVRAERLDEAAVLEAVIAGEMYASTGIELDDVSRSRLSLAVTIAAEHGRAYRTTIIGPGGVTLDVIDGADVRVRLPTSLAHVRVRVEDSDGRRAWLQPLYST
jgi:hypothetical protein